MSDLFDIIIDMKKGSKELIDGVFGGVDPVTDINKAADRNTLNVYTIVSDSAPDAVRANIAKQIESKVGSSVYVVMASAIEEITNTKDVAKYFEMKFKGIGGTSKHTDSFHDRLIGSIDESFIDNLDFNTVALNEAPVVQTRTIKNGNYTKKTDHVSGHVGPDSGKVEPKKAKTRTNKVTEVTSKDGEAKITMNSVTSIGKVDTNKQRKDNFISDGTVFNITLNIQNNSYTFAFRIISNIIVMSSMQLLDAMQSARGSDNLYNYVKVRQGQASFFSDFLLNFKSIQKKAKEDFSKDLNTRILSSITKNAGGYKPKFFADISEFKHYMVCITDSERDQLKKQFNVDLTKPAGLTNLFENLLILELLVVNPNRNELAFYSSNDPHKYTLVDYSKLDSSNDAMRLFQTIMRT